MSHAEDTGTMQTAASAALRFFRADASLGVRPGSERGTVRDTDIPHPATVAGLARFAASAATGAVARVLYTSDDMHVAYAWFKSGFPLPLHSHDADCFYQIIAGSMQVGTEELQRGDGVLIPGGTPYTVTPGPDGVEFIEVRPTHDYDTRYRGRTEAYWDRIVGTLAERQQAWATEVPPFGLLNRCAPLDRHD